MKVLLGVENEELNHDEAPKLLYSDKDENKVENVMMDVKNNDRKKKIKKTRK